MDYVYIILYNIYISYSISFYIQKYENGKYVPIYEPDLVGDGRDG